MTGLLHVHDIRPTFILFLTFFTHKFATQCPSPWKSKRTVCTLGAEGHLAEISASNSCILNKKKEFDSSPSGGWTPIVWDDKDHISLFYFASHINHLSSPVSIIPLIIIVTFFKANIF